MNNSKSIEILKKAKEYLISVNADCIDDLNKKQMNALTQVLAELQFKFSIDLFKSCLDHEIEIWFTTNSDCFDGPGGREWEGCTNDIYLNVASAQEQMSIDLINQTISILETPTIFINLTPHAIHLPNNQSLPTSGTIARVGTKEEMIDEINNIPVVKTIFTEIENLPEPEPHTIYIVSAFVAQALKGKRDDVICPDTGKSCIRNTQGQIVAITQFTTY